MKSSLSKFIPCARCGKKCEPLKDFVNLIYAVCWECFFKDLKRDLFGRWPKLKLPWWSVAA